jgi:23S rRNA pseudouridine1911/1915/1917 synthase
MVTHPAYGNRDGTLVNAVLYHVCGGLPPAIDVPEEDDEEVSDDEETVEADESDGFAAARPGIVHRLDKDTSGLMVVAKNTDAQTQLAKQFFDRTIKREYYAIAWGVFKEDEGEIEGNIARDPRDRKKFAVSQRDGKYALTRYRVIERFDFATLVALRLATGRTHQIRVHCAHIGHPIFGDATYGGRAVVYPGSGGRHKQRILNLLKIINRQALHARSLGLKHPRTGEWMEFDSELPEDMRMVVDGLRG